MKYTKHNTIEPENEYEGVYMQLLRFCCAGEDVKNKNQFIENSIEALEKLVGLKGSHFRLVPIILQKIKIRELEDQVSTRVFEYCKRFTRQGIVTELGKKKQLEEVIQLFHQAQIPMILLKGSAFNANIYAADFPRLSNDIDVLVKKSDFKQATQVLLKQMSYQELDQKSTFDGLYETSFVPKGNVGANLDLHRLLVHPFLFDIKEEDLWTNSKVHPAYNNENVRALAPEYNLIHLAIHGFKDMNFSSYSLVDTHRVICSGVDIDFAIEKSFEFGAQLPLYFLLKNYVNVFENQAIRRSMENIKPPRLISYFANTLLKTSLDRRHVIDKSFRYRFNQMASQFIFTSQLRKPLALQYLFFKTVFIKKWIERDQNVCV